MDNKYQISKSRKPETKQEILQHQIEELVQRWDKALYPADKKGTQWENHETICPVSEAKTLKVWGESKFITHLFNFLAMNQTRNFTTLAIFNNYKLAVAELWA